MQADLGLCCTNMPEDTFLHGAAQIFGVNIADLDEAAPRTVPLSSNQ